MEDELTIVVIAGTAREARQSIKAARFVADIAASMPHVNVLFVDPKDFTFPNDGDNTEGKDPAYTEIVKKADGFFIVTPEYNHSFPGALKRMLDSEYTLYKHKPVALAGVSNGDWGGTRAIEGLLPTMRSLGLLPVQFTSYFPRVQDIFDEQGVIHETHKERYTKSITGELNELIWLAKCLKWGRANLNA